MRRRRIPTFRAACGIAYPYVRLLHMVKDPILLRLEQAGWLTKEQESVDPHEEGRPPRRLYRLTASGADAARHELACLRQQLTTARLPSRLGYAAGAQ